MKDASGQKIKIGDEITTNSLRYGMDFSYIVVGIHKNGLEVKMLPLKKERFFIGAGEVKEYYITNENTKKEKNEG